MKRFVLLISFLFASAAFAGQIDWGNDPAPATLPIDLGTDVIGNLIDVGYIDFDLLAGSASAEGRLFWDAGDGTLGLGMVGGDVTNQIGQETLIRVTNKSTADIKNGNLVYMDGAIGNRPTIALASNDDAATLYVLGMATEDIDDNATGFVTITGLVRGAALQPINTNSFTEGDRLYLDTAGGFTNIHPSGAGIGVIVIGTVLRKHTSLGVIVMARPDSFTLGDDFDGTMRLSIINKSTGVAAASAFTAVNDAGYWVTFGIGGSNHATQPNNAVLYTPGYADFQQAVDGNKDFVWYTDPTDSHDNSSLANEVMRLSAAGVLTPLGRVNIEGEWNIGTIGTFGAADTTPDPAGASYWKTSGAVTITDFDGSSYVAGQIFVLEIWNDTTINCEANQIYCGNVQDFNRHYEAGDFVTFIYRSDGLWAFLSEAFGQKEHTVPFAFIGATIDEANDVGIFRHPQAAVNPELTRFSCVASGATTSDMIITITDCDATLVTCGVTNATLIMDTNDKIEADDSFSDADLQISGWWKFEFTTVTVAPEILQCEISYVSS